MIYHHNLIEVIIFFGIRCISFTEAITTYNRDARLISNDIVIISKTMGKYSKTGDDLQYGVDFIVI